MDRSMADDKASRGGGKHTWRSRTRTHTLTRDHQRAFATLSWMPSTIPIPRSSSALRLAMT